mmetsp:Transcript_8856/g.20642  ORF Transcript_8856/g.20642 Transcript_8856/m.20642 type:complete len:899 (+) Transcript_8856:224-2920(+)|eukprot:CAMPEP_0182556032 /NCGR_PEP_ID=MMETSP1324-20130603/432_1 /TAXON_ID=236786 /ORGANISM="Florenciella sp., Strain RCC1587" /LENGTH=898 /DNA_ID=CAMNT_0024767855 /DNA_START=224 /DNA_END=2920 /DNA_ORIENTATION=+
MAEEEKAAEVPAADAAAAEADAGGGNAIPPGCKPMFIQMAKYEEYGLGTNGTNDGVCPWKTYTKEWVLEECNKMGFMSDFHPFMKDVQAYPGEDVLIINDPEQKYGDNFYICLTVEAKEREMGVFLAAEKAAADAKAKAEAEEAARLAAEEARRNAVYEDKPVLSRPYVSETAEATQDEVRELKTTPERPLLGCTVVRPRSSFGHPYRFDNRDAEITFKVPSQMNPDFQTKQMERDVGLQGALPQANSSSQTTWYRPVNKGVQYSAVGAQDAAAAEDPALVAFLKRVRPQLEDALQQNETVDIFKDAFAGVGDEDAAVGQKGDNELKEMRNYNDIKYSKNMSISAIDWHPTRKGMIAVSPTRNLSFDERVEQSGQAHTAHILLWDFIDLIHPQIMLQSPHEMFCFRFNPCPGQQNLVAAGCLNGQVIIWDIAEAMATLNERESRGGRRAKEDGGDGGQDEEQIPPVEALAVSQIDFSHRGMVADMAWLPPNTQVNIKGQLLAEEHLDGKSHQFLTLSGDGSCLVWDLRYADIAEGHLPHIAKPRHAQTDKNQKGPVEHKWLPLFRMQLKRLEGVGELSLCKLCLGLGDETSSADGLDRRSQLFASTEEGEIVFADWRARPAGAKDDKGAEAEDDGHEAPEYVQWMAPDHGRPCVALQPSPFFPEILLSVGDWNFQLWKLDHKVPIFSSPAASTYLTAGKWSPTRPGMLFIARTDGGVDVWDLTDSSYTPSVALAVSATRITSMEFLPSPMKSLTSQLLAVGDSNGNLHIFDMPRNLWRAQPNEKSLMANFIDREVNRVDYVAKRSEIRREEAALLAGDQEDGAGEGAGDEGDMMMGQEREEEDVAQDNAEAAEEEALYEQLEKKFIEELELSRDDLPEHWRKTHHLDEEGMEGAEPVQ